MKLDDFEQRALPHLDAAYRLAMVLADDALDASNLVQGTYQRAMASADQIAREDPEFRLSLLRILRALFAADSRSTKYAHADLREHAASVDARQAQNHDDLIREVIRRFPARYRSVLLLWSVEDLTYEQIAEIEDVPTRTVRRWLHDARTVLHELLETMSCTGGLNARRSSHLAGFIAGQAQEVIR